jgi:hypothetical protein
VFFPNLLITIFIHLCPILTFGLDKGRVLLEEMYVSRGEGANKNKKKKMNEEKRREKREEKKKCTQKKFASHINAPIGARNVKRGLLF